MKDLTPSCDLLGMRDLEPPMGDFAIRPTLAFTRAVWATPIEGEDGAPERRIIHSRILQLHGPARINRLGIRRALGYHKCGSRMDLDWVSAFRVLIWNGDGWGIVRHQHTVEAPPDDGVRWFDLGGVATSAVILEARRSRIDDWWSGWNVTSGGFVLDGETAHGPSPRRENHLVPEAVSVNDLPEGVEARHQNGEVRFRSRFLEVGFSLNRTGFTYLSIDEEGRSRTGRNILRMQPGSWFQGVFLSPVGAPPLAAMSLRNVVSGSVLVEGNSISYNLDVGDLLQSYRLTWQVDETTLTLEAERRSRQAVRAWRSSAWCVGLDSRVAPAHVLGRMERNGEAGLMGSSVLLHVPSFGSLRVGANGDATSWRSDAFRPFDMTLAELKLGEQPQQEGDFLLPAGSFGARVTLEVDQPEPRLLRAAPPAIQRAVAKCAMTALTFRADTSTLSNNGASIHCPISMDNWSAVSLRVGRIFPDLNAAEFLQATLERWLDGGPGYTSGPLLQEGQYHEAEDEYVMTAAAGLLGLAEYLKACGTPGWLHRYRQQIGRRIERTRTYDVDGDGLIESVYRTGTSGSGQWGSCWLDVVSFGWKDAFSNALLYSALVELSDVLPALGAGELSHGLAGWARRLRAAYHRTFFNPATGWLGGWRCKDDKLHDHAFPMVTGAAVCGGVIGTRAGREMLTKLLEELAHQRPPHGRYGLPISLWEIPDDDLADIMQGYPKGYYQNAGLTHAQSRHFVGALYRVGLTTEADRLLEELCEGLADGLVYGGTKSGVDWRGWDGSPCGYEGLLTDQFGILAVAFDRWAGEAADDPSI